MADERDANQSEEMNNENNSREEDIVSDTDADTKDVEQNQTSEFDETEKRFSSIEATLDRILGQISSIRESQGILVENGAVVHEGEMDTDFTGTDSFVPPAELDLLI